MSGKPEAAADGRRGLPGRQPADRPVGPANLLLSESARRGRARRQGGHQPGDAYVLHSCADVRYDRCNPDRAKGRDRKGAPGSLAHHVRPITSRAPESADILRDPPPCTLRRWRSSQRVVEQASDQGAGGVDRPVAVGSFTERGQAAANLVGRESLAIPEHDCRQPGGGETELLF